MIKAEKVKWWNRWLLVFFGGVHKSDLVEVESEDDEYMTQTLKELKRRLNEFNAYH